MYQGLRKYNSERMAICNKKAKESQTTQDNDATYVESLRGNYDSALVTLEMFGRCLNLTVLDQHYNEAAVASQVR